MDASEAEKDPDVIDVNRIMNLIPHRYPFLLVDRLVDVKSGESCTGIKNVTVNEPHFSGHFPSRPVFPGVLLVEAMAQTAGALVIHSLGEDATGKLVYFLSIDSCRFRRPVVPGDQLRIHVARRHHRGNVWKFEGQCKVDGAIVAEATYSAMIVDDE